MPEEKMTPPNKSRLEELLETNLATNQEILKSVKFLKGYFHWKTILNIVKWVIIILIVIFGFISLKPIVSSMQNYVDDLKGYSDQLESASEQVNNLKGLINVNNR